MADVLSCDPHILARLVVEGDDEALERMARCYRAHLLGVGRCACGDEASAEDAVQEALCAAGARLSQFREAGSVKAWLSSMVVNACRAQRRGRKNDAAWNRPLEEARSVRAAASMGPGSCAARAELAERLMEALEGLGAQDRALFLLAELEERSGPELAEMFGVSAQAIRARLSRIRRRLRGSLEGVWGEWRD